MLETMLSKAVPMELKHIVFLLIFFVAYVILGGVVFMLLESPEEEIRRKDIELALYDFSEHIKGLNHPNITEQYIRDMIAKILEAQDNNLLDNSGNQSQYINWSFINSFFFAITVTTTIGYGHLTPSTTSGKIFCIIYALFGIPITSLLIGSLADRFSKLYSQKMPKTLRQKSLQQQISARMMMLKKAAISLVPWFFVFLIVPAILFTRFEKWTFIDGFYYCFVTLSTIGFGDFVAGSFEQDYIWIYKIIVIGWIIFGVAYLSMVLNFITQSLRSRHISNVMHSLRHRISANPTLANRMRRHPAASFERQQSSPVVFFAQNGGAGKKMISSRQVSNSSTGTSEPCPKCETCGGAGDDNFMLEDMVSTPCPLECITTDHNANNQTKSKTNFIEIIKNFRMNRRSTPGHHHQHHHQNQNSIPFNRNSVGQKSTNSLPELSADYSEPSCSSITHDCSPKITVV